jgi:hypothetical protein
MPRCLALDLVGHPIRIYLWPRRVCTAALVGRMVPTGGTPKVLLFPSHALPRANSQRRRSARRAATAPRLFLCQQITSFFPTLYSVRSARHALHPTHLTSANTVAQPFARCPGRTRHLHFRKSSVLPQSVRAELISLVNCTLERSYACRPSLITYILGARAEFTSANAAFAFTAHSTASTALPNSARTLSPAVFAMRPLCSAMTLSRIARALREPL